MNRSGRRNTAVVFVGGPADRRLEHLDQQHVTIGWYPLRDTSGKEAFVYEISQLPWDVNTRIAYPRAWGERGRERALDAILEHYYIERKR